MDTGYYVKVMLEPGDVIKEMIPDEVDTYCEVMDREFVLAGRPRVRLVGKRDAFLHIPLRPKHAN